MYTWVGSSLIIKFNNLIMFGLDWIKFVVFLTDPMEINSIQFGYDYVSSKDKFFCF